MNGSPRVKLSAMMFLEFFIWGAWLPPIFGYLGPDGLDFTPFQQMLINNAFPVSAILAMFFGNQFVDRNFSAERFLAFSHLVGGLAVLGLTWAQDFWTFFLCMSVHCLFYVPTISVTNTIAFANLKNPQHEFGMVRLWGTIGWIAAAWPFVFLLLDWDKVPSMDAAGGFVKWMGTALGTPLTGEALNSGKSWAFFVSGVASLLLAALSLSLPHTPPKPAVSLVKQFAWLEAIINLLKHPFMIVLFVVTFIDATVHDGYFVYAFQYLEDVGVPSNWVQPAMSVGQIAEILTMAMLGLVLKRLGWRYTMILGILGHAARFAVFALFPDRNYAVAVNVLHGICYAFFFATLYIFVDEFFPKDARTSAQGLFNFLILGMGPIASRVIWPMLRSVYTETMENDKTRVMYEKLLLIPSGAAIFAALLLLFFFHPPARSDTSEEAP